MALVKCELLTKSSPHINGVDQTSLNKQPKKFSSDMQEFSANIRAYVRDVLNRDTINITPGIAFEKKSMNHSSVARQRRGAASLISQLRQFTNDHVLTVNLARASTETGRLFFFKGKQNIVLDC